MERHKQVIKLVSAMSILHEEHDHHGRHVAELAKPLAIAAGLSEDEVEIIEAGAHLHDIGKIFIPKTILNAPRKLEPDETTQMRMHTTLGWAVLEQSGFEHEICEIVRNHHERYDGNGYPDRLQFQQISIGVRIVSICDVYGALVSPRTYRDAFTPAFAKSFIQSQKGKAFDARLVDLFFDQAIPLKTP